MRRARERGVDVIAETCPQYLYLDTARLERSRRRVVSCARRRCAIPWHVEELWHGLATGAVHTVATDHCPFTVADRRAGMRARTDGFADFTEIPGGLPGIETRLGLVWEGVAAGRITRADWVRLCAEAPARTFGLWPAKGNLRVGRRRRRRGLGPGRGPSRSTRDALHMNVDHSPYAGLTVTGWPEIVLSRGDVVARDGRYVGEPARGRFVARSPVAPG